MMLQQWQSEMFAQMYRERRLRETAEQRLFRQARAGQVPPVLPAHLLLAWLGRRMVAWGVRLQERYDRAVAAATCRISMPAGEAMGDPLCTGVHNH